MVIEITLGRANGHGNIRFRLAVLRIDRGLHPNGPRFRDLPVELSGRYIDARIMRRIVSHFGNDPAFEQFDPVIVGSLAQSKSFDSSAPIFLKTLTARELRTALKLPPQ